LVLLIVLPLLGLGGWAFIQVGSGFMPAMDEGGFILDYHTRAGTSLTETDRLLRQVEAIIQKDPNVQTYSRRTGLGLGGVGLTETNQGDFFIRLKPQPREPIETVMENIRGQVEQQVPGVQIELAQLMEDVIGDLTAVPQPIEVKIFADDPHVLKQVAKKTAAAIGRINGIVDVNAGITPAGDAIEVHVDSARASIAGLTTDAINQVVQDAMTGRIVTRISPANAQSTGTLAVRVWIPANQRQTILDLQNLPLRTDKGAMIRLQDVAQLVTVEGQSQINREQMQRMVAVTARINGRDLGSAVKDVQAVVDAKGFLPADVRVELGGLYAQQQIAFHGLMIVFATAVALVFLLLLFLYERFDIALSVLLMPLLAVSSVFIGLWLTGIELNISAMMGMTMIIGIVTEVAIFYFSEYNMLQSRMVHPQSTMDSVKKRQKSQRYVLILAGQNRMRPIAMTTIAAILTLLPLAFALGEGSAMQQPLAIAIIAGLVVQLPLVLLVMPVLFALLTKRQLKLNQSEGS
jgi:multidrug efflux pump subunit AcrB